MGAAQTGREVILSKARKAREGLGTALSLNSPPVPAKIVRKDQHIPSLLSADLRIDGDITSTGPVHLDGEVQGDIRAPLLTVGESARVSGVIEAKTAKIGGSVTGHINAQQVELSKSANVTGDILHDTLAIEAGAFVNGNFKHRSKTASSAVPVRRAPTPVGVDKTDLQTNLPNPLVAAIEK